MCNSDDDRPYYIWCNLAANWSTILIACDTQEPNGSYPVQDPTEDGSYMICYFLVTGQELSFQCASMMPEKGNKELYK